VIVFARQQHLLEVTWEQGTVSSRRGKEVNQLLALGQTGMEALLLKPITKFRGTDAAITGAIDDLESIRRSEVANTAEILAQSFEMVLTSADSLEQSSKSGDR